MARTPEKSEAGETDPPAPADVALRAPTEIPATIPGVADDLLHKFARSHTSQAILAAVLAWAITIAPAAFARGSPGGAQVLAVLAFLAGIGGPLVAVRRRRLGRHLGVSLFLALAVYCWVVSEGALAPARLDPTRAGIGGIAWGVFALSWSDRWRRRTPAPVDPNAPALQARATLPPYAVPIAALGFGASLALMIMAWRVREPDRAVVAHAVAVSCAVALTTVAAAVATSRGKRYPGSSRRLGSSATRPLILLAAFALAGAVLMAIR